MKAPLKLLLLIVATLLLACLLAPPLSWLGNWVYSVTQVPFLADLKFQKYFNRAVLVAAILMLWPSRIWLKVGSWEELGLRKNPRYLADLAFGFVVAFILLLFMGLTAYWLGIYNLQGEIRWGKLSSAAGTTIVVPLLEEWLFRGVLLGLCLRVLRPWTAILYISALFSIIHFLKPIEEKLEITQVRWTTGFEMLPHIFHQFVEPLLVLSGFTTLLALGLVLAITRVKTASLWLPIGLHAGIIFGQRFFNIVFKQVKEVDPAWLSILYGKRIEIGIAPLITVTFIGLVCLLYLRDRTVQDPGGTSC